MSFADFKKGRKKLKESVQKMKDQGTKFKKDERLWLPTKDGTGSSNALIRFLPQPDIEQPPTISYFSHGFKEKGKWFIENCPSTFMEDCPVCMHIQPYWDEDTEESCNYARRYSRTKQYVANILVIKDLVKPENNGKVFLFRFGVKIYEKIEEKIFPESELDSPIQIFDPWEGANFKLKLRQKSGRNNYDTSQFVEKTGPICKDDEKLEVIFNQLVDLGEFLERDKFKSFDQLEKKFNRIMRLKPGAPKAGVAKADEKTDDALLDDFEDGPDKADAGVDKGSVKEDAKVPDKAATVPEADKTAGKADDDFDFAGDDDDFNFEDD